MNRRLSLIAITFLLTIFPFLLTNSSPVLAAAPASIQGLHVVGNKIVNGSGQTVRLLGVNRSGAEFMCVQGKGIWDGPTDAASIQTMASWKINAVRVPLNEDCWLGINGVNSAYAGSNYQQAIVSYVNLLNSAGLVAILDLHWTAAGTTLPTGQAPMPDRDHAPAFWQSVATTFKSNSSVIFDLFNEPFPDQSMDSTSAWNCLKNGGTCPGLSFTVAGMQELVTAVRGTGATNVIMTAGLRWTNDLSQWLTYKPSDTTGNLAASMHVYNFNSCVNSSCWDSQVAPVLNQVPLVVGEMGENDCGHGFIDTFMNWLDAHNASYLGWTWNTWDCGSGPALISDYNGTPTGFGVGLKNHLASLSTSPTNTSVPPTLTFAPPTNTSVVPTATQGVSTSTSVPPTPINGSLSVGIKTNGTDNNQQTAFSYQVKNNSSSAVSGISVRVYFTTDNGNAASNYAIEKYYDQSGVATISGPTLASGSIYYFTVSYGTTALNAGNSWEFQTGLHLANWASNFDGSNDWYHTGYAVAALPASYTNTNYVPAYVSGSLVWGTVPGGTVATNTPTNTATPVTPTSTAPQPDLTITSISYVGSSPACTNQPRDAVVVANSGTANAGAFVVSFGGTTQSVSGLAAGQSTTLYFSAVPGAVTATADSTNVIAESNETNNSLTSQSLPIPTQAPTCTPTGGVTNTPTLTATATTTATNTATPTATCACGGGLTVGIKSNGTDNNQQTAFAYQVKNTGSSAVSGISVRVYFTTDNGNAASNYTLEKYYDQSGVATISGPTLASGSTYYFTVSYGTTSLNAGGSWEFQTALHLANWGSNFSGTNDWYHTGYAAAALPASYTNTNYVPAYVSGTLTWGTQP